MKRSLSGFEAAMFAVDQLLQIQSNLTEKVKTNVSTCLYIEKEVEKKKKKEIVNNSYMILLFLKEIVKIDFLPYELVLFIIELVDLSFLNRSYKHISEEPNLKFFKYVEHNQLFIAIEDWFIVYSKLPIENNLHKNRIVQQDSTGFYYRVNWKEYLEIPKPKRAIYEFDFVDDNIDILYNKTIRSQIDISQKKLPAIFFNPCKYKINIKYTRTEICKCLEEKEHISYLFDENGQSLSTLDTEIYLVPLLPSVSNPRYKLHGLIHLRQVHIGGHIYDFIGA